VALRVIDAYRFSKRVAGADDEAELDFVVEPLARAERRLRFFMRPRLPVGTRDRSARNHHRRGAAVIADRDPLVARQQRIVRAHHLADAGGVMDAGVEVAVVADRDRQKELRLFHRHQEFRAFLLALLFAKKL
jgi:hypothetical protein